MKLRHIKGYEIKAEVMLLATPCQPMGSSHIEIINGHGECMQISPAEFDALRSLIEMLRAESGRPNGR